MTRGSEYDAHVTTTFPRTVLGDSTGTERFLRSSALSREERAGTPFTVPLSPELLLSLRPPITKVGHTEARTQSRQRWRKV